MGKKSLLEQSIADANELRNLALETAKQDLIEAFQPHIKSMISKVIENDEDLEGDEDIDQLDVNDENEVTEGEDDEETLNQTDDYDEEEIINTPKDDEEIDLDIEDDEMTESDDMDLDDEEIDLDIEDDEEITEEDEEIDLDIEDDEMTESDDEEIDLDIEDDEMTESDDEEIDLDIEDDEEITEEDDSELDIDLTDMEDDEDEDKLDEAYRTIKTLKKKINEVKLLNYKLFCSNKIFNKFSLNRKQKVKIIESMDRAKNLNEVKLIYQILFKNLSTSNSKNGKRVNKLKESVSRMKTSSTRAKNPIITEEHADAMSRRQLLAGIRSKK